MGGDCRLEVAGGTFVPTREARHLSSLLRKGGLLRLLRAQLGGPYVSELRRLEGADGPGALGGLHIGVSRQDTKLAGVRVIPGGQIGVVVVGGDHLGQLCALVG